jgi:hypothetical protein
MWLGLGSCFALFWFAGVRFDVPYPPSETGALLLQQTPIAALFVAGVALLVCVVLGSIITSTVHFDAGLVCAAFGLSALSMRGGPMRDNLFAANGPGVYLTLALELLILYGFIAAGWGLLRAVSRVGLVRAEHGDSDLHPSEPLDQRLLATLTQVVVMSILMMILSQSDQKAQALASVGIAAFLGALAAHQFVPARPSLWFWIGPLAVGLLGYLGTYFNPGGWSIGEARGMFAPLARAQPLDYASFGPAGAIMGYWVSRRWHRGRVAGEDDNLAAAR